jgi:hypothetical protein
MYTKLIHESFLLFIVSMKYYSSCENISIFYSIVSNKCIQFTIYNQMHWITLRWRDRFDLKDVLSAKMRIMKYRHVTI